jgi:hypothetical protein
MEDRKKILTIISLGAGVQSSTMAIMAAKGDLPMPQGAVFSDTQNEPRRVYDYLKYLKSILPYPVHIVTKGHITNDMISSIDNGTRFPTAPFFTQNDITGKKGMLRRQCTNDYKIQPIRQKIRELCGVARMKPARDKYILNKYPLIDLNMSRQDCLDYLKKNNIPLPEKSACIVCPYHNDAYWHFMKTERPEEFAEAVAFDKKIRLGSRSIKDKVYLHRKCIPLDEVEFDKKETDKQLDMFNNECTGMCGQ